MVKFYFRHRVMLHVITGGFNPVYSLSLNAFGKILEFIFVRYEDEKSIGRIQEYSFRLKPWNVIGTKYYGIKRNGRVKLGVFVS